MKLENRHILVAHPDAFAADRLRQVLEAEGALVAVANSGALSLGLSEEGRLDLLIVFAGLTDMRVAELVEKMRAKTGRPVPCLVVSAFLREDQALDALKLPNVLVKDRGTDATSLRRAVLALLGGSAPVAVLAASVSGLLGR